MTGGATGAGPVGAALRWGALVLRAGAVPGQLARLGAYARTVGRSPVDLRLPFLPFGVVDFLDTVVGPGTRVFEFGGGGSTLWFADRAGSVTTVEHDAAWAEQLRRALTGAEHVTLHHVPSPRGRFDRYVQTVLDEPDESLDVVLVDGRSRLRCVYAALPKLRPGGLLVLDDTDRPQYQEVADDLRAWRSVTYTGVAPYKTVLGTTTVWRVPAGGAGAVAASG